MQPFNPRESTFHADPYAVLRSYRERDPIHWSDATNSWLVTRYDDVASVLKDNRFGRGEDFHRVVRDTSQPLMPVEELRRSWFLFRDPPDHTRLRTLVGRAFTPRTVRGLEETIHAVTNDLLDRATLHGEMELMSEFAYPLTVTVIATMLGVPLEDRDLFWQYASDTASVIEMYKTEEDIARANRFTLAMEDYFRHLLKVKRRDPQDDLISGLIALEAEGDHLTEEELIGTCSLLLFAGHETTANLIGNGLLDLLQHPDQLDRLGNQPELMETAVTELLRYSTPVLALFRVALHDVEIRDTTIYAGQTVMCRLISANRDPAQFSAPDRLDITRQPNRPLSFGHGIHYCLGAPLAQLEARIALATILHRMPNLQLLTDHPRWRPSLITRGLEELLLAF